MTEFRDKLVPFKSGFTKLTDKPQQLVADQPCDEVWLSVSTVEADTTDALKIPTMAANAGAYQTAAGKKDYTASVNGIFFGFETNTVHQIQPGERIVKVPVANANQIFVRANVVLGAGVVNYSLFKTVRVPVERYEE